jgi:hypothetical protein
MVNSHDNTIIVGSELCVCHFYFMKHNSFHYPTRAERDSNCEDALPRVRITYRAPCILSVLVVFLSPSRQISAQYLD